MLISWPAVERQYRDSIGNQWVITPTVKMPLRIVSLNFVDPIFDKAKRDGVISRGLTRIGKRFKTLVVNTMIQTQAKGRLYEPRFKGNAAGFTRSHRASIKGDPPAPDTMNLTRSVKDRKMSPTAHEVYVDDGQAPYGKFLERPRLNRPIMKDGVLNKFITTDLQEENARMAKELTGK